MRFALALVALLLPTATFAQEPLTAEEEVQCALAIASRAGDPMNADQSSVARLIMHYFYGRYEGRTGKPFNEGVSRETIHAATDNYATLMPRCMKVVEAFAKSTQSFEATIAEEARRERAGK